MDELNVNDLINAWQYQDKFEKISMNLIEAGIQLGVRATGVEMLKALILKDIAAFSEEEIKKLLDNSYDKAANTLRERMKNARGS